MTAEQVKELHALIPGAMRTKRLAYHSLDFYVEAKTRHNAVTNTLKKTTKLGLDVVAMTLVGEGKDETFIREGGKFVPGEEKSLCTPIVEEVEEPSYHGGDVESEELLESSIAAS